MSSSTNTSNNNTSQIPQRRNLFQKTDRGSEAVYEVIETKNSCVHRIDLPGCPNSDLTYWIDGTNLHFFADEPAISEYKHEGRKYGGTLVFNEEAFEVKEAKAEIVDGVLWVTTPKIPGVNGDGAIDVTERLLRVELTRPDATA